MSKFSCSIVRTGIEQYFQEEIWKRSEVENRGFLNRAWIAVCRVLVIAGRGFMKDRCSLYASALTYITLVSLVPVLAIMLSFCKGIGMQNKLLASIGMEEVIQEVVTDGESHKEYSFRVIGQNEDAQPEEVQDKLEKMPEGSETGRLEPVAPEDGVNPEQAVAEEEKLLEGDSKNGHNRKGNASLVGMLPEAMQTAIINLLVYVEKTNFAALGLVGFIALLVTVVTSIKKLEDDFNAIWNVPKGRTFARQFSEYIVLLLLIPVIMLAFISTNTFVTNNEFVLKLQEQYGGISILLVWGTRLGVSAIVVFGFTFLFMFMPNTKVKFVPAFVSSVITTVVWGFVQWAYIGMQVGLTKYNAIYGTFAVLPFFLAWLYANWNVILLGCELSFAVQNRNITIWDKEPEFLGAGAYMVIATAILNEICVAFRNGKGPWRPEPYSEKTGIPMAHLKRSLNRLFRGNLIVEAENDGYGKVAYMPARPPADLTLRQVSEQFTGLNEKYSRQYCRILPEQLLKGLRNCSDYRADTLDKVNFDLNL